VKQCSSNFNSSDLHFLRRSESGGKSLLAVVDDLFLSEPRQSGDPREASGQAVSYSDRVPSVSTPASEGSEVMSTPDELFMTSDDEVRIQYFTEVFLTLYKSFREEIQSNSTLAYYLLMFTNA